jgi:16S rRNA (cytidine1402-2'-O)-methyltransferase
LGKNKKGTLFLVGTPIGNLQDITLRALETLRKVALIAAEDTRHTQKLLNHFQIKKPLTSYHEHNKNSKGPYLIEKLKSGIELALVSDAGLPGISDPGEELVKLCVQNEIPVMVIPGPTACLTALVASGLDCGSFVFLGFLPVQKKAKEELLQELKWEKRTLIFYIAPHHLLATLKTLKEFFGERRCCLGRELTKKFEEYQYGFFADLINYWEKRPPRGEFTLIVSGRENVSTQEITPQEIWAVYLFFRREGLNQKEALREAAKLLGVAKREIYRLVHQNKNGAK